VKGIDHKGTYGRSASNGIKPASMVLGSSRTHNDLLNLLGENVLDYLTHYGCGMLDGATGIRPLLHLNTL
jgi:hypothetical protein